MKKIWVYDDETGRGQAWADKINMLRNVRKEFDVKCIPEPEFGKEMSVLVNRQANVRQIGEWGSDPSLFDEASMLVIDYDLLKSSDPKSFLVGETVAYLARCFSRCGLIIGLNQYGANSFDLTLRGHPESYADLNIGGDQVGNPGLWGVKFSGFRPWHWPILPIHLESFDKRVNDVIQHPRDPICRLLGMEDIIRVLPRSATQYIGGDPLKTTFSEFVKESEYGLRGRDEEANDEMIARIGAARVSKWLERLVLPGQDILVDAPHLVSRFPSLLEGRISSVMAWNKTAGFLEVSELGLDHSKIEEFRFNKSFWLSRPAWFWRKLSERGKIKEVTEPWNREGTDYVFCEDSAKFARKEGCGEFLAGVDSPYVRRFICHFEPVKYEPIVRLMKSKREVKKPRR